MRKRVSSSRKSLSSGAERSRFTWPRLQQRHRALSVNCRHWPEPARFSLQSPASVPEFGSEKRRCWPATGHPTDTKHPPDGGVLSREGRSRWNGERSISNDGSRSRRVPHQSGPAASISSLQAVGGVSKPATECSLEAGIYVMVSSCCARGGTTGCEAAQQSAHGRSRGKIVGYEKL